MSYLYDDIFLKHDTGMGHPEAPARLTAVNNAVKKAKWYDKLLHLEAKPVNLEIFVVCCLNVIPAKATEGSALGAGIKLCTFCWIPVILIW